MCVARPEIASPQLPPSVIPTPCASGRAVQQGNAARVTLSWPHAARAANAASKALPRQVWMRLRPPKLRREISDFDGQWKFSSPAARRCETPCGEEYCCLGRRAKKSDTFDGRCAKCTAGCADLATLDFRVLLAMDACLLPRTKRVGRGAATLAADRVALAHAVAFTAFLQPIPSPPLSCRHAHPVIISDASCGRAYTSIVRAVRSVQRRSLFALGVSNRSEKACTRLNLSCGAPPHAPGSPSRVQSELQCARAQNRELRLSAKCLLKRVHSEKSAI